VLYFKNFKIKFKVKFVTKTNWFYKGKEKPSLYPTAGRGGP
jgi:hypothetical protein